MNKLNPKKLALLVVVFVVAFGLFAAGYYFRTFKDNRSKLSAKSVGDSFVEAMITGDTEKAYNLTSDENKGLETQEQFADKAKTVASSEPAIQESNIYESDDQYMFAQIVQNVPENNGTTVANFHLTIGVENGNPKVLSYLIL